jgi:signal transduction histidine kinase
MSDIDAALLRAIERGVHDLDEVRLPLHILLENQFGDLNDNQVELVGAARDAAETAAARLRRARDLLALQPGQLRQEPIRPADALASLVASLQSRGSGRGVRVSARIAAPLPALRGDRIRVQEALSLVGAAALAGTPDGGALEIAAEGTGRQLVITLVGGAVDLAEIDLTWAARVIAAHGGAMQVADASVRIQLPTEGGAAGV